MSDREQLIQELSQAPDELIKAVLEFLHQLKANRAEHSSPKATLVSFVRVLQNLPSFSDDPVTTQRQMRDEWD